MAWCPMAPSHYLNQYSQICDATWHHKACNYGVLMRGHFFTGSTRINDKQAGKWNRQCLFLCNAFTRMCVHFFVAVCPTMSPIVFLNIIYTADICVNRIWFNHALHQCCIKIQIDFGANINVVGQEHGIHLRVRNNQIYWWLGERLQ